MTSARATGLRATRGFACGTAGVRRTVTPMGEEASYCERCWSVVPTPFGERHDAWHASGRPWLEFFDERELEAWSSASPTAP